MTTQKPTRKDWALLIFIIPIGVLLLLFVGQWAIRVLPFWSVNAGMNSNLEPDSGAAHPFALLEPLLPQILIPPPWAETYLDPNGDFSFPPFLTFEPTASPAPTQVTPSQTAETPTTTVTDTPTPTSTPVVGPSPTNPGGGGEETPTASPSPTTCTDPVATNNGGPLPCTYPPTTCTDPLANNQGQPLPCTYPPTTCTDPLANNQGQPLPCTYPPTTCTDPLANNQGQPLPCTYPPTTCTDPAATNNGGPLPCTYPPVCPGAHNPDGPLPCDYGTVSTPPADVILDPSPDTNIDVGGPPNNSIGGLVDGYYIVLNISVTVGSTPDNNYDLVFYEFNNSGAVYLDWVIIGISNEPDGSQYYEVFNWGDGSPDVNSNLGDVAGSETDNQPIDLSELHDPDGAGSAPQTGILIDVDTASSNPPPVTYNYVVIISPVGGSGEPLNLDAVQATEVPTPTP